jgi:paraquat-inducible protein A
MRTLIALLIAISAFSLALGITQPLMRFEHLVFFTRTPSLIEMVGQLWTGGDRLLGAIVALFSIVFPAGKVLAAQALLASGDGNPRMRLRMHRLLGIVSKWSMMDVLIVAVVIVAAKTSGFADAFTQPGLWFYATSVATAAVATHLVR